MNFFDDYFVFSTSEKKGIFIFVCILFLMTLFYMVMPYIFLTEKYDFTEFKKELETKKRIRENSNGESRLFSFNPNTVSRDSLLMLGLSSKQSSNIINYRTKVGEFKSEKDFRKIYSIEDSLANVLVPYLVFEIKKSKSREKIAVKYNKDSLFNFDPNTATFSQLRKIGLSSKQSQTVLNYRNKVGKFSKKEDLKKIYSIPEETYLKLEPYIIIETKKKQIIIKRIELNSASKEQLVTIKGIGDKTANRIITYRDKLGGYSKLSQLGEIYGLDSTIKNNKMTYFDIENQMISKLNLNTVTFKELLSHPYCDYNSTKKIINYREMHGDFKSLEQIIENNLIKAEQYRKIAPYLILK